MVAAYPESATAAAMDSHNPRLSKIGLSELSKVIRRVRSKGTGMVASELAKTSYWHPNGFLKATVSELADGSRFRLHYWPAVGRRLALIEEEIHTHRWDYWSMVISGRVSVETFAETEECGEEYLEFVCSQNAHGSYRVRRGRSLKLSCVSKEIVTAGRSHFGSTSTLHRCTRAGVSNAITAFVQSTARMSSSSLMRPIGSIKAERTDSSPANEAEIKEMLELIAPGVCV